MERKPRTEGEVPDWEEILKGEVRTGLRNFVVPKEPEAVRLLVAQAVHKSIACRDLTEDELRLLINDTPVDPKVNQVLEEAFRQGKIASEKDLDSFEPYYVDYDWFGMVLVERGIRLNQGERGDCLVLGASLDKIGENIGFPTSLLERKWEAEVEGDEEGSLYYNELLGILGALGYQRGEVELATLNSEMLNQFSQILGYQRVYNILEENEKPSPVTDWMSFRENIENLMRFVYLNLSEEEKQKVISEREAKILPVFVQDVDYNGQKAKLVIDLEIVGVDLHFNPETGNIEGDLRKAKEYHLDVRLRPILTLETRHNDLLELRKKAAEMVEGAGLID